MFDKVLELQVVFGASCSAQKALSFVHIICGICLKELTLKTKDL